jgi:hypothetical protein
VKRAVQKTSCKCTTPTTKSQWKSLRFVLNATQIYIEMVKLMTNQTLPKYEPRSKWLSDNTPATVTYDSVRARELAIAQRLKEIDDKLFDTRMTENRVNLNSKLFEAKEKILQLIGGLCK